MKKTSTPPTQQGPKRQSAESTSVDLDASIQRLIVVSDLHAYREPLEAVDCYLGELTDDYLRDADSSPPPSGRYPADTELGSYALMSPRTASVRRRPSGSASRPLARQASEDPARAQKPENGGLHILSLLRGSTGGRFSRYQCGPDRDRAYALFVCSQTRGLVGCK